jgi:hypothetical protein
MGVLSITCCRLTMLGLGVYVPSFSCPASNGLGEPMSGWSCTSSQTLSSSRQLQNPTMFDRDLQHAEHAAHH